MSDIDIVSWSKRFWRHIRGESEPNRPSSSGTTTNPNDPGLRRRKASGQQEKYLISDDLDKSKFVRPVRTTYVHKQCGVQTTMSIKLAETYARDPKFYGATFCCGCQTHLPVSEFFWHGTKETVGS